MSYDVQVLSPDFHKDAKITQLCTISANDISVSNWLDNSDPYPSAFSVILTNSINSFNGTTNNIFRLDDAPEYGAHFSFSFTGAFTDYIMFTRGHSGDIYVPLGKITWGTSFGATSPSTNISPNSVTTPIGPDNSQDWPAWPNVFSNPE